MDSRLEFLINQTRIKNILFPDYSKTIDNAYYMNHCQYCGTKKGDFFLYEEPSGPFFINNEMEFSKLYFFDFNCEEDSIFTFKSSVIYEPLNPHIPFKKEKFFKDFKL